MPKNYKNPIKFITVSTTLEASAEKNDTFNSSTFTVCKIFSSFLYSICYLPYKLCVDEEQGRVYFSRKNRFHTVSNKKYLLNHVSITDKIFIGDYILPLHLHLFCIWNVLEEFVTKNKP
jgi:hypothetical protein